MIDYFNWIIWVVKNHKERVGGKCKCKILIFPHKPNLAFLYKMALNFVNKYGRASYPKLGDEAISSHSKKGQLPHPCLFTKLRAILYSKPQIPTGITRIFFHCIEYLIICMCVSHMNWNVGIFVLVCWEILRKKFGEWRVVKYKNPIKKPKGVEKARPSTKWSPKALR